MEKVKASAVKNFCERTNFHGFANTVRVDFSRKRRLLWIFLEITFIAAFFYIMGARLTTYYTWPSVIEKAITYTDKVPFPSVTLCNENPFRLSSLHNYRMYDIIKNNYKNKNYTKDLSFGNKDQYALHPVVCDLPPGGSIYQEDHVNVSVSTCINVCTTLVPNQCSGFLYDLKHATCTLTSFTGEEKLLYTNEEFELSEEVCIKSGKFFVRRLRWTDDNTIHCSFDDSEEDIFTDSCRFSPVMKRENTEMWIKAHGNDYTFEKTHGRVQGSYLQMSSVYNTANLAAAIQSSYLTTTGKCLRLHVNNIKSNAVKYISQDESLEEVVLRCEEREVTDNWKEINIRLLDGIHRIIISGIHTPYDLVNSYTDKFVDEITLADCETYFCGFVCENGKCLTSEVQCDGYFDCIDGSDEIACPYNEDCHYAYDRTGSIYINEGNIMNYSWASDRLPKDNSGNNPFIISLSVSQFHECKENCTGQAACTGFMYTEQLLNPKACHLLNTHDYESLSNFTKQDLAKGISVYTKTTICLNTLKKSLTCDFFNDMCDYQILGGQTGWKWVTKTLHGHANKSVLTLKPETRNELVRETPFFTSASVEWPLRQKVIMQFFSVLNLEKISIWIMGSMGLYRVEKYEWLNPSNNPSLAKAVSSDGKYNLKFCIPEKRQQIIVQVEAEFAAEFNLESISVANDCDFKLNMALKNIRQSINSLQCTFENGVCGFTALSEHLDFRWRIFPKSTISSIKKYSKSHIFKLQSHFQFYRLETYMHMTDYQNFSVDYVTFERTIIEILDIQGKLEYSNGSIQSDIVHVVWILNSASGGIYLQCHQNYSGKSLLVNVTILGTNFLPSYQFTIITDNRLLNISGQQISLEIFLFLADSVSFMCDYRQWDHEKQEYVAALIYDGILTDRPYTHQFVSPAINTTEAKCFTLRYVMTQSYLLRVTRNDSDGMSSILFQDDNFKKFNWRVIQIKLSKKAGTSYVIIHSSKSSIGTYENTLILDSITIDEECLCPRESFNCGEKCIDISQKCDVYIDCVNKADELGCSYINPIIENRYACGTGRNERHVTIEEENLCDGVGDCHNNYDEKPCVCPRNKYYCHSGECIDKILMCDGSKDCTDYSDETCAPHTGPGCNPPFSSFERSHYFYRKEMCYSQQQCVLASEFCDGVEHCKDGKDEDLCQCPLGHLQCADSECVPFNMLCDKWPACSNGKDERLCTSYKTLNNNYGNFNILRDTYKNFMDIQWDIKVADGMLVALTVYVLGLQHHSQCSYDYLSIFDTSFQDNLHELTSLDNFDFQIAAVCSEQESLNIESSGSRLRVKFVTNEAITGEGFTANFSSMERYGFSKNFHGEHGIISTPNYPFPFFYSTSVCCSAYKWNITVKRGYNVRLRLYMQRSKHVIVTVMDQKEKPGVEWWSTEKGRFITFHLESFYKVGPWITLSKNAKNILGTFSQLSHPLNATLLSRGHFLLIMLHPVPEHCKEYSDMAKNRIIACINEPVHGFIADYLSYRKHDNDGNKDTCLWQTASDQTSIMFLTLNITDIMIENMYDNDKHMYDVLIASDNAIQIEKRFCSSNIIGFNNGIEIIISAISDEDRRGKEYLGYFVAGNESTLYVNVTQNEGFRQSIFYSAYWNTLFWNIFSPKGSFLILKVQVIRYESQKQGKNAYINVFDTFPDWKDKFDNFYHKIAELLVTNEVVILESMSNNMRLEFMTEAEDTGICFDVIYTFVDAYSFQKDYSAEFGLFSSPNYPYAFLYNNDLCCGSYVWNISISSGLIIYLNITIKASNLITTKIKDQPFDYLAVINDGFYPSEEKTATLWSNYHYMTIELKPVYADLCNSDYFAQSCINEPVYGFTAEYKAVSPNCRVKLPGNNGYFSSRNFPYEYRNNEDCEWHIVGREGITLALQIDILGMEFHPKCIFDVLSVYEKVENVAALLGHFCSNSSVINVISNSNEIIIKFSSNNKISHIGFTVHYSGNQIHMTPEEGGSSHETAVTLDSVESYSTLASQELFSAEGLPDYITGKTNSTSLSDESFSGKILADDIKFVESNSPLDSQESFFEKRLSGYVTAEMETKVRNFWNSTTAKINQTSNDSSYYKNLTDNYQNLSELNSKILQSYSEDVGKFLFEGSQLRQSQIINCEWAGQSCDSLFTATWTDLGRCLTFSNVSGELYAENTGSVLRLLVNAEPLNSVQHLSKAGLVVYIHDQNELPQMKRLGTLISPGNKVLFKLKYRRSILQWPGYGSCGVNELDFYNNVTYTMSHCLSECESLHLMEKCSCVLPHMPRNSSMPVCSFPQYVYCVLALKQSPGHCSCPAHCNQTRFDRQLSYSNLTKPVQEILQQKTTVVYKEYMKRKNLESRIVDNKYIHLLEKLQMIDTSIVQLHNSFNSEMHFLQNTIVKSIGVISREINADLLNSQTGLKFAFNITTVVNSNNDKILLPLAVNMKMLKDQYASYSIDKQQLATRLLTDTTFSIKDIRQAVKQLLIIQSEKGTIHRLYSTIRGFQAKITKVYESLLVLLSERARYDGGRSVIDIAKLHIFRKSIFDPITLKYKLRYTEKSVENDILVLTENATACDFMNEKATRCYIISRKYIDLIIQKREYESFAFTLVSSLTALVNKWVTSNTVASHNVMESIVGLEKDLQTFQNHIDFNTSFSQRGLIEFEIGFDQLKEDKTTQQVAYSVLSFFSDVGGFLGLLLGATALTLCEIIDLLCYYLFTSLITKRKY